MRRHGYLVVFAALCVVSSGEAFAGSNTWNSVRHYFRYLGTNYTRDFALAGAARPVEYDGTAVAPVCPSGHLTRQNNHYRHLHHNHTMADLPATMINGVNVNVTSQMVADRWDNEYAGYGGVPGGQDLTHNCYGHALASGTFVAPTADGLNRWIADYVWTAGAGQDDSGAWGSAEVNASHSIKTKYRNLTCTVASMQTPITKITDTSEKFYDSTIYTQTGGDCDTTLTLKNGPFTTYNNCNACH